MPVQFDEYENGDGAVDWAIDPDSNGYTILEFLASHPETGFTPSEIRDATNLPKGSVGTALRRLADKGLVRHKQPDWAIDQTGIHAYEITVTSVRAAESPTTYDWGGADPSEYRVGLDVVTQEDSDRDN